MGHSDPFYEPVPIDQVNEVLSTLWAACDSFGKSYSGFHLKAWEKVLRLAEVQECELQAGSEHFMRKGGKMPTPAEFVAWIQEYRETCRSKAHQASIRAFLKEQEEAYWREYDLKHPERIGWGLAEWRAHFRSTFAKLEQRTEAQERERVAAIRGKAKEGECVTSA